MRIIFENIRYLIWHPLDWRGAGLLNVFFLRVGGVYRGADKSLSLQGGKQATVTEDFDVHVSYL